MEKRNEFAPFSHYYCWGKDHSEPTFPVSLESDYGIPSIPETLIYSRVPSHLSGRASPCLDQGYHTLVSPASSTCSSTPVSNKHRKYYKHDYFEKLSDELVLKIFSWMNTTDLCVASTVCRRWYNLAWDQSLWRKVKLCGDGVSGDRALKCILRRLCSQVDGTGSTVIEEIQVRNGAKISDKGLTLLSKRCPKLSRVCIQNCLNITDSSVSELVTRCPNLHELDLTGCHLVSCINVNGTSESPWLLLQHLNLTDCISVQDVSLRVILRSCPNLVYLYLRRCAGITDTSVQFIPVFCQSLRELSLSDCSQITDLALHELAKFGPNLRYLSVAKCTRITDVGLKEIAKMCCKLRYLNVRGCETVSDDSIVTLARSCRRLRALDIGRCDISDVGLRVLAENCPDIRKLSLRNCELVTDRGIQYVSYYCRFLQQLNIQDCHISLEGYKAVKRYCKGCVIEHTNPGFF